MTDRHPIKTQTLIDGLRRYQEDFNRDFCFRDIIPESRGIIPKELFKELSSLKDEKLRIEKLFSYFIYKKRSDLHKFVEKFRHPYKWLYDGIINSESDKLIKDYRKAIQDIPNNNDWNVHRTEYLLEIQHHLKMKDNGKKYMILFGQFGFGKKWLAADACRDFGLVSRMNFKVFWLNVSKCHTQELILEKMHRLKVMMQADELDIKFASHNGNTKTQIVHLRNHLRKIMERPQYRDCLIVLIGVQDENILKAFELPCKFLITTRHIERLEFIPQEQKLTIEINRGFDKEETLELFKKAFRNHIVPNDMLQFIDDFHTMSDGHPFILSMIAKSFHNFDESAEDRIKRCENRLQSLEKYDLHVQDNLIEMAMKESLKYLSNEYHNCYRKMVIFTDNRDIPYTVLEKLWNLTPFQTEEVVIKLRKYSLIENHVTESNEKACSLHYLQYMFLLKYVPPNEQIEYHQQLIEKYEVERIIKERKDLNLDFPKDNYFHFFIPYHWKDGRRIEFFKLYLDFEFLEQKMRITGLPNTSGDLKIFGNEIIGANREDEDFFSEILDFLTNFEQQLYESNDVNLLQLALNSSGAVREEADKQIKQFPNRVWMRDINHGGQTQIVQFSANSQPQIVRFVKPSKEMLVCLISLKNTNILLQHIIQDYHDSALLYRNDLNSKIVEMQEFRDETFLSLTENGRLSVYSLKNVPKRRNSIPLPLYVRNAQQENLIQRIGDGFNDRITCFYVTNESSQVDLLVGLKQGTIKFFTWKSNKLEEIKQMIIKTKFDNLCKFVKIELFDESRRANSTDIEGNSMSPQFINEYLMLMNCEGKIFFIDLKSSGEMASLKRWEAIESPVNLHQGDCKESKCPITLCVAKNKVVQIVHKRVFGSVIDLDYDDIYVTDNDHEILSSAMSIDAKYLILGTTKGILVIDRIDREIIMKRNVSEKVVSLDVTYDENVYIISSVFEDSNQVINLHGFDVTHRDDSNKLLPLLVGDNLFDVKKYPDYWEMIAVDDKNHIQYRNSQDEFTNCLNQNEIFYNIKKIIYAGDKIVIGCTSGAIYKVDQTGREHLILELESEITYMEMIEGKIVASCNSNYVIIESEKKFMTFFGKVTKAYRYNENQMLLVKKNCAIEILNFSTGEVTKKSLTDSDTCTAQTYCSQFIAIATFSKRVFFWNFDEKSDVKRIDLDDEHAKVTALAVSPDKSILAIGCSSGGIEIVDLVRGTSVKRLIAVHEIEGRKKGKEINNLYFSPWTSPSEPLILMSASHSIMFWNIRSILNNSPLEMNRKISRASNRFRSPYKALSTPPDTSKIVKATENLSINDANPWSKKMGSTDKPELLSCIKLIGKTAKQVIFDENFDRFVTIDNEGNIYYLRLIADVISDNQITVDYNGNPMESVE